MAVHHVLDNYYLAITLLVTVGYQLLGFSIAFTFKFDKLTDFAGGTNFAIVSILTLALSPVHTARQIVVSIFLILWSLRLSGFLLFRILKTGTDTRFDDKRDKFFPFLGFWVFQMLWVWAVSLPVTILNSPNVAGRHEMPQFGTAADVVGIIMWVVGFATEAIADVQKYRFRSNPAHKGRTCDVGLFAWSRHPNYFGEILVQFAIFTIAVSPSAYGYIPSGSGPYAAQYASIVGPFFLTLLLLFVSGLTLQERPGAKKKFEDDGPDGPNWTRYKQWLDTTSILIPMPKTMWTALPIAVKRTIGAEWPIYVFVPERDVDPKKLQERRSEEGAAHAQVGSQDDLVDTTRSRS
ncbi:hypothetical protein PV10_05317 [Exophiala mesophila]|uniref:Steroid 5-alpha reductase C-terminal domain-containing protein n=1 Tax=Exophiala mesophila TaxID=212818 RepID=A0A0D1Z9J3_EXOME|nr:uncharacterized protein PV10_05317 [Exophiala mesophila]KIV90689.1 hypothetical protein PV10_05317 [Exophiala mesophila]